MTATGFLLGVKLGTVDACATLNILKTIELYFKGEFYAMISSFLNFLN